MACDAIDNLLGPNEVAQLEILARWALVKKLRAIGKTSVEARICLKIRGVEQPYYALVLLRKDQLPPISEVRKALIKVRHDPRGLMIEAVKLDALAATPDMKGWAYCLDPEQVV